MTENLNYFTIKANEDTDLAVLDREVFLRVFGKLEKKKLENKVAFFLNIPIFSHWNKSTMTRFVQMFYEKSF